MVAKVILFVCAQALLLEAISGQCIGAGLVAPWATPCGASWGSPFATAAYAPSTIGASYGGALPVASASAIPPSGVSVLSENTYCGELAVRGALPFLGTVGLEGVLPTAGAGAVAYGCGNGDVAMLTEDIGAAGIAGPFGYGAGLGSYGYAGARSGCGCGRVY